MSDTQPHERDEQSDSADEQAASESRDVSPKETTSKNDGPNKRRALQRKQDEAETTRCLKSIAETLAKPINIDAMQEEDEEDVFGHLVAMRLRRIANRRLRADATMHINRVLMDADFPPHKE